MSALDLFLSRKALAAGVGLTTRRNKVLPASGALQPIPARIGRSARPADVPTVIINGDLYQPPSGYGFNAPAWYTDAVRLVSSDGIYSLDKSQWKRWTGRAGSAGDVYNSASGPLVHCNFSSPDTDAVLEATAGGGDLQFTEGAWSTRVWHELRPAPMTARGQVSIIQRLRSLTFAATGGGLGSSGLAVTWTFSDDDDAASSITTKPAPINQAAVEQGLSTRVMQTVTVPHVRKINLTVTSKQLTIKTETPYGWLPTLKENTANGYVFISAVYYANDLAKINRIGQPYHGLGHQTGLVNGAYALRTPLGYQSPPTTNTRYFKKPGTAMPPDPSLPENAGLYPAEFITAGDRYWNDVVFFGGRNYCPSTATGGLQLTDSQFLHVDDAGVVRLLRIAYTGRTASTTSWNLWNDGPITFAPGAFTPVNLGSLTITTTSADAIAQYTGIDTTTKVAFQTGSDDVQGYTTSYSESLRKKKYSAYRLATKHPVAHSPNGRQIALFRGIWYRNFAAEDYNQYVDNIHTVATFDIASDLTVSGPTDVFQWVAHWPADRVTNFTYAQIGTTAFAQELATTTMTPFTDIECRMITYLTNGNLRLILEEHKYEAASGTKLVNVVDWPLHSPSPRAPMTWPSEVETDINMKRVAVTLTGLGDAGDETISGGVSIGGLQSLSWRMANNLLYFLSVDDGGSETGTDYLVTPLAAVARTDIFPTSVVGSETRYASYNPRLDQIGGVEEAFVSGESFTKFISWV